MRERNPLNTHVVPDVRGIIDDLCSTILLFIVHRFSGALVCGRLAGHLKVASRPNS